MPTSQKNAIYAKVGCILAITEIIPQFSPLMNRAAETIAHAAACNVEPIGRVDDAIDRGITRTATERNATLIIGGWKTYSTTRDNFPVSLVRGKFVRQVSQILQMDDLLILTAHTQPNSLLSLPGQLVQPEAIARIHPDTFMIVVHFPLNP